MKILAYKSGRGGALAVVEARERSLLCSYEAEKDNYPKNSSATVDTLIDGALWFSDLPDVLALSGDAQNGLEYASVAGAGYFGIGPNSQTVGIRSFFGRTVNFFSSTHERAHIWSAYGMSPFPQGMPIYMLVWDDVFGDFYEIDEALATHHLGRVMEYPCQRFALPYGLADKSRAIAEETVQSGDFGRMMSVASFGNNDCTDPAAAELIDQILKPRMPVLTENSPFRDISTNSVRFRNLAARLSNEIFLAFEAYARRNLTKGYPLILAGEGALNCVWATRWRDSGLFPEVFAAPAANDSGCAIGTAVDAMRHFTGAAKLEWSVYAGKPFEDDAASVPDFAGEELDFGAIAGKLAEGHVIGWARGNCEIGPRALGNRSILAAPFEPTMRDRINRIKGRPDENPVAPICLAEDVSLHFDKYDPSPHMLYLAKVVDDRLGAITHVNGSARLQTVSRDQNSALYDLLVEFKHRTGVGVLCNTSLNFKGAGFINKTSDLHHFAQLKGLDGFLAGIRFYQT